MLLGRVFHELGAEWVKDLCPYRAVLILGITSVREFCDLSVLLGLYILRWVCIGYYTMGMYRVCKGYVFGIQCVCNEYVYVMGV